MAVAVQNPFVPILNLAGVGLNQGKVYVGVENQNPRTNPVAVFWDQALTIAAAQPLTVIGGYTYYMGSPRQAYTAARYSYAVDTAQDVQVFYEPSAGPLDWLLADLSNVDASPSEGADFLEAIGGLKVDLTNVDATPTDGAAFLDNFEANAANIRFDPAGTGAVQRTSQSKLRDFVTTDDFGIDGTGTTDDTVKFQAAIDYCLSTNPPRSLTLTRNVLLNSSVLINRLVDTTSSVFTVNGPGRLVLAHGVTAFDSSLPFSGVPVSERVCLDGVRVSLAAGATDAVLFSQKFLRIQLINVFGRGVRILDADDTYAQDWHMSANCNFAGWTGTLFKSGGAFDVISTRDCQYRLGSGSGNVFEMYDPSFVWGVSGCNIQGSFESNNGNSMTAYGISGLVFGGYFEGNGGHTADFTGSPNNAVSLNMELVDSLAGNLADAGFYEVLWGDTLFPSSRGCRATGRLHDDTGALCGPLLSIGESAGLSLNLSGRNARAAAPGVTAVQDVVVPFAAGGQAGAVLITAPVARIVTAAAPAASIKLRPTNGNMNLEQKIINRSGQAIQVFGSGNHKTNDGAATTGVSQANNTTVTYTNTTYQSGISTGFWYS